MTVVRVESLFAVPAEQAWDFLFADQMRRAAELSRMAVGVEGYEVRADGTPRYTLVSRVGPLTLRGTSDYFEFDRPRRTANRILGSAFGGVFRMTFTPGAAGTRVAEVWEVEPQTRLAGVALPLVRPLLRSALQRDLDAWARGAEQMDNRTRG